MQTIEATENAFSYTTCEDPLGTLCVVASDRGLRWIEHGEDRERVVRAARERFADARLVRDDVRLREFAAAIAALSGGGRPGGGDADGDKSDGGGKAMARDVSGTPFQLAVWAELDAIPRGETRSYSEIARAIGRPRAARAVARACGANPLPVLVPCHRVIEASGRLGGYAGGLWRKRSLLRAERPNR